MIIESYKFFSKIITEIYKLNEVQADTINPLTFIPQ